MKSVLSRLCTDLQMQTFKASSVVTTPYCAK